ncbi:MAG: AAA family ATPase [Oscillospiraceae bacterium]|jgi:hypothetical protein
MIDGLFQPVERKKAKLRMALCGVSGSGKTLGALYIAYGITGDWSKVALIDTEHERARFYANRSDLGTGEFLYAPLTPPYSPDKYKDYVNAASELVGENGVVIVDSFSHAWNNEGGVLDIKDQIAARQGKNSYTAWNEAGKVQNSLVNTILAVNCHTIVTMRSKMDYVLVENDRGKLEPQKLGLAPIQRDDTEYEFDVVLNIARNHIATASKDTTVLDRFGEVITPEIGKQLGEWMNKGKEPDRCAQCGQIIKATPKSPVSKIIQKSTEKYGEMLCYNCSVERYNTEKAAQKKEAGSRVIPEQ